MLDTKIAAVQPTAATSIQITFQIFKDYTRNVFESKVKIFQGAGDITC